MASHAKITISEVKRFLSLFNGTWSHFMQDLTLFVAIGKNNQND
jgi:hypothetical protein